MQGNLDESKESDQRRRRAKARVAIAEAATAPKAPSTHVAF